MSFKIEAPHPSKPLLHLKEPPVTMSKADNCLRQMQNTSTHQRMEWNRTEHSVASVILSKPWLIHRRGCLFGPRIRTPTEPRCISKKDAECNNTRVLSLVCSLTRLTMWLWIKGSVFWFGFFFLLLPLRVALSSVKVVLVCNLNRRVRNEFLSSR